MQGLKCMSAVSWPQRIKSIKAQKFTTKALRGISLNIGDEQSSSDARISIVKTWNIHQTLCFIVTA